MRGLRYIVGSLHPNKFRKILKIAYKPGGLQLE
jgi:hypothetical protein